MSRGLRSVVLVSSSTLFCEGLTHILMAADFEVVASVRSIAEVENRLVADPETGRAQAIVIVDFDDDICTGIGELGAHARWSMQVPLVVLAARGSVPDMVAAFRAGANAFLLGDCGRNEFQSALELAARGEKVLPSAVLDHLLGNLPDPGVLNASPKRRGSAGDTPDRPPQLPAAASKPAALENIPPDDAGEADVAHTTTAPPRLSPRQQTILRCLISGDTNKVIARKTELSEATVKVHIKTILRKIQVRNRTQAAIWAMRHPANAEEATAASNAKASVPGRLQG